jgi:hypothetical protein
MSDFGDWAQSESGQQTMAGVASLLAGLAQRKASKDASESGQALLQAEGAEQSAQGQKLYETMLSELRSGKYDVSQAQRDLARDTKESADRFIDETRTRGQERRGDIVSAIQGGDARSVGLADKSSRQIEKDLQGAELTALQTKVGADKAIADLEQSGLDRQARLTEMELMRGSQGAEAGRQMELQAMLAQAQAGPQATQEGIQTALATYAALFNPEYDDPNNDQEENMEKGGKLDLGREGMKTNGEFSHETNPKAIIDEDTGVKEGEVTGGELVFNPKQSNNMEDLINRGDAKGLLKYLKDLLSEPQFQA